MQHLKLGFGCNSLNLCNLRNFTRRISGLWILNLPDLGSTSRWVPSMLYDQIALGVRVRRDAGFPVLRDSGIAMPDGY